MKKVLAISLVVFFVVSVTAAVVSAEPVVVKEKKIVAMANETGQVKAVKGVAINKETGEIKAAKGMVINRETGATKADIEMVMKYLEDDS